MFTVYCYYVKYSNPLISIFLSFFRLLYISLISKLVHASTSISPSAHIPLSICLNLTPITRVDYL